ncbi:MAG: hypothetical protein ACYSWT_12900 [Planctomycetota bacterium]|jgi:hypothetical protein
MLSRWRKLGFRSRCDTIDVDRLLRLQADEARVAPSPGMRRRTLAALREASLRAEPLAARQGPMGFAYAVACGLLVLLAAAAALNFATPRRPQPGPVATDRGGTALNLLSLDTGRLETALEARLSLGPDPWEAPLMEEARLLVADARQARAALLARLPRAPGG